MVSLPDSGGGVDGGSISCDGACCDGDSGGGTIIFSAVVFELHDATETDPEDGNKIALDRANKFEPGRDGSETG